MIFTSVWRTIDFYFAEEIFIALKKILVLSHDSKTFRNMTTVLVRRYCKIQFNILKNSAKLLKPGGRIVYSTCSIDPEENEQIVERFLNSRTASNQTEQKDTNDVPFHDQILLLC